MKVEKVDRRVKYTKYMLKEALVALIREQHISTISVKALCEKADINRSTFYVHYSDPYDLLNQIKNEVLANVMLYLKEQDQDPTGSNFQLTTILEYAKKNSELFETLFSENCDYVFQDDILELSQIISSQYNMDMDETAKKYLKEFGTSGCISVFERWLQDGAKESPEYISEFLKKALQGGIMCFKNPE
ncbi:MAG: TetR/AcrR family transcriptional regulator [Herbinix sp.]|jgi:AcrR family transcriptional regulator|nr:TetR/AcrR family transcriptional regulator [Herbinix sp.]